MVSAQLDMVFTAIAQTSRGVVGRVKSSMGVFAEQGQCGVAGESDNMHGVLGDCHNASGAGVFGTTIREARRIRGG